ncbi:MAG TPA: hypothetical protein VGI60_02505 [Chthoniobacterales bacterium]|jgi:hypothetical protein
MKLLVLISLFLTLFARSAPAERSYEYDYGYEPRPPVPFPSEYRDYQILPGTTSPDQRYAFIYPKRSLLFELQKYGLFLAALNPFHILSRVPTGYSALAEMARSYYAAGWSKDSSTTVFVAGGKWGPDKVWVLKLRNGKIVKKAELTAAVRRQVLPDFKKSHATGYNDYFDFIFDDDHEDISGWGLDDSGHVMIDTVCTTDPKELEPHRWAVHFQGIWDVASGKFLESSFTHIPPRHSHDATASSR